MNSPALVAIIDDDSSFRESMARLIRAGGYRLFAFGSADEFLTAVVNRQVDCAIIDIQMPGLNGLELQRRLNEAFPDISVVFLTGHGDIPDTVRAMREGAVDFLEKPVAEQDLFAAIGRAMHRTHAARGARDDLGKLQRKYKLLTPREREVFSLVTAGLLNKQIAFELGASERTIKAHRRRVVEKLEAESLAHLVRLADRLRIELVSEDQREAISGRRIASST